jgi:hypothetical protein
MNRSNNNSPLWTTGMVFGMILFAGVLAAAPIATHTTVPGQNPQSPQAPQNSPPMSAPPMTKSSAPAMTNTMAAPMSASSEKAPTYTYVSDTETENITQAIYDYNKQNPNEPINELTEDAYYRLQKNGFIRVIPQSITDLILREGKVLRRVKQEAKEEPVGDNRGGESLSGSVDAAIRVISQPQLPKGTGNPTPQTGVEMIEKTIQMKVNGSYKDLKVVFPRIPEPPREKEPQGTYIAPRPDLLQRDLSSPVYMRPPVVDRIPTKTQAPTAQPSVR